MPRRPTPLPAQLGSVFTHAQAASLGVPRGRLLQPDVARLARGIYARTATLPAVPEPGNGAPAHPQELLRLEHRRRALALGPLLQAGEFFAGRTAAVLWSLPVTLAEAAPASLEIAAISQAPVQRVHAQRARRVAPSLVRTRSLHGVPVTDPATTWAMLAPELRPSDAVALGDAAVWRPRFPGTTRLVRPPLATLAELAAAAATPYRRGGRVLRGLLPLLSTQSASPPESHLRLRLAAWGAPQPHLDYDVRAAGGRLLGCSEIAFPQFRVALEYEGGHHFSQAHQFARDIEKYQSYAEHGWQVLRITSRLLYGEPEELRRQVFATLRRRGWAP